MSNLVQYAKSELKRAFKDDHDPMQQQAMRCIMELVETFADQGHSGFSGNYVLRYFDRLARFQPIGPLTGEENEWQNLKDHGDPDTDQNIRCGSVFRKHGDNSTAYNIEGKIFVDEDGITYLCAESRVPVIFPYEVPDKPEIVRKERPK